MEFSGWGAVGVAGMGLGTDDRRRKWQEEASSFDTPGGFSAPSSSPVNLQLAPDCGQHEWVMLAVGEVFMKTNEVLLSPTELAKTLKELAECPLNQNATQSRYRQDTWGGLKTLGVDTFAVFGSRTLSVCLSVTACCNSKLCVSVLLCDVYVCRRSLGVAKLKSVSV